MTFLNPYGGASQRGHGFSKLYIIQAHKNVLQNKFCNNKIIKKIIHHIMLYIIKHEYKLYVTHGIHNIIIYAQNKLLFLFSSKIKNFLFL